MKIYNKRDGKVYLLPANVNGNNISESLFYSNIAYWAKKEIYEFDCEYCDLVQKYELTPTIVIEDNIATYSLNDAENYLIENDNWHLPSELISRVGSLEDYNPCLFYWFRIEFNETTSIIDNEILDAMFNRAVARRLAPYLGAKNKESKYYLYLSYIQLSDGFTIDGSGNVIAPSLLTGIPIEQLAPAKIEGENIVLA